MSPRERTGSAISASSVRGCRLLAERRHAAQSEIAARPARRGRSAGSREANSARKRASSVPPRVRLRLPAPPGSPLALFGVAGRDRPSDWDPDDWFAEPEPSQPSYFGKGEMREPWQRGRYAPSGTHTAQVAHTSPNLHSQLPECVSRPVVASIDCARATFWANIR